MAPLSRWNPGPPCMGSAHRHALPERPLPVWPPLTALGALCPGSRGPPPAPLQSPHSCLSAPPLPSAAGPPEAWPCPPLSSHPLTTAPRLTMRWPRWLRPEDGQALPPQGPVSPPSSHVSPEAARSHSNAASSEPSRTAAPAQPPLLQCCPLWLCAYSLLYQEGRELPEEAWSLLSPQHKAWHAARITGQSETQRCIPHLPRRRVHGAEPACHRSQRTSQPQPHSSSEKPSPMHRVTRLYQQGEQPSLSQGEAPRLLVLKQFNRLSNKSKQSYCNIH